MENEPVKDTTGKLELLYDGVYYDVTNWIKKHPGGSIINLYARTGEDSTLAVQQFHQRSTKKVMGIMKSLPHRKPNKNDRAQDRTISVMKKDSVGAKKKKHRELTADFLALFETCKKEGLFEPSLLHVVGRISEILFFAAVGLYCIFFHSQNKILSTFGMLCTSLAAHRSGWVQHEGGHHSLLGIPMLDRLIQKVILGLMFGMSGSYWINQHSRHHASPQHVKHDVDLKTLPLLAFNEKIVKNPKNGKSFLVQNQKWLFLFDTFLVTWTWKLYLHPRYCIFKRKYDELLYMTIHYIAVFTLLSLGQYCGMMWLVSMTLLGNFTLNHSHLPVTEEPTHWVEYSLTHTANIRSSTFGWVDYWMGNLNYQIEHHLFPTMPQYKNKLCRDRVKALANKHNLPYHLYSYGEAVQKSFDNLGTVSKELALN